MPERATNRRDLIVSTAAELFGERGYAATSVRQIARAVGCTEAALYYHFDGKRQLLLAVIDALLPRIAAAVQGCPTPNSLAGALKLLGEAMSSTTAGSRWLLGELPHLQPDERAQVLERMARARQGMVVLVAPFCASQDQAERLILLLMCVGLGHEQLVGQTGGVGGAAAVTREDLMATLVALITSSST